MSEWVDTIGDFKTLTQKAVLDKIGSAVYLYVLARRAGKHSEIVDNVEDYEEYDCTDPESVPLDPYFRFETFDQVLSPKKKPTKKRGKKKDDDEEEEEEEEEDAGPYYYTYNHSELKAMKDPKDRKKSLKGSDGKVKYEIVEGEQKVKKFLTVGVDAKKFLTYLFNKFLKEALDCFEHNGNKFKASSEVADQLCDYVIKHKGDEGIAPFIIAASKLVPVDNFVDDSAIKGADAPLDLGDYLLTRASKFFKDGKNRSPNKALSVIVESYVAFLKVLSVLYIENIWGKNPGATHIAVFEGVIRQMYLLLSSDEKGGHTFQYEIFDGAHDWVKATEEAAKKERENKPAGGGRKKKPAAKKDDEEESEEVDNDEVDAEVDELAEEDDDDEDDGEADAEEVDLEE